MMTQQETIGKRTDTLCGPEEIRSWIVDLSSRDAVRRSKGRLSLVAAGDKAVRCLVEAMGSRNIRARRESVKVLDDIETDWSSLADEATIRALASDLGSKDYMVRTRIRWALVRIGSKAVAALEEQITNKDQSRLLEVVKALSQIGDARAAATLINMLDDNNFGVRWLAAEGLIAIGIPALMLLLRRLLERADSPVFREGAHHVLHGINPGGIENLLLPVRRAIEGVEPEVAIPPAVDIALQELEKFHAAQYNLHPWATVLKPQAPYGKTPEAFEKNEGLFSD
ncbi:MAG: HEAT repeat domain-containing protein [Dehalococcoidales bacterium]|nr:HEAT repeat domain-containing protein [Dehalococcoidales bacterium]